MLAQHDKNGASIQLFYTEDTQPERMERFLVRARGLGILPEVYIMPIRVNGKDGFRALYGAYPDINAASAATRQLPERYRKAFAPALYLLGDAQTALN